MQCEYKTTETFKKIIDSIKEIVDEAVIQFFVNKMYIFANDEAKICFVNLCIESEHFESYNVTKKTDVGTSLSELSTALKLGSGKDVLKLSKNDEGPLHIKYGKSKFDMNLKTVDLIETVLPENIEYAFKLTMSSKEFNGIVKNLSSIGDTCMIQISDIVEFGASGEIGKGTISPDSCTIEKGGANEANETNSEETKTRTFRYSMKLLNSISKSLNLSDDVIVYLRDDELLCVEYTMKTGGYIRYYLAPKNL